MEIIIQRPTHDSLLRENQLRWKLYESGPYLQFFIYAGIGLLLTGIEWIRLQDKENYWSFSAALGMGFCMLAGTILAELLRGERKYFDRSKALVNRLNKLGAGIDVKINDASVSYKDAETFFEVKWTAFNSYKMYKDYLFLVMNENSLNSIAINKNEISPGQFEELLGFIAGKLPKR